MCLAVGEDEPVCRYFDAEDDEKRAEEELGHVLHHRDRRREERKL